jgi:E3 ubiquitin-protein ligase RNF5
MVEPVVYSWLNGTSAGGEEDTDTPKLPVAVNGPSVSGPQLLVAATGLEGDDLRVARSMHPSPVARRITPKISSC